MSTSTTTTAFRDMTRQQAIELCYILEEQRDKQIARAKAAEAEAKSLREVLHLGTELDNHHNAKMCPYCTPDVNEREKRLDLHAALGEVEG